MPSVVQGPQHKFSSMSNVPIINIPLIDMITILESVQSINTLTNNPNLIKEHIRSGLKNIMNYRIRKQKQ